MLEKILCHSFGCTAHLPRNEMIIQNPIIWNREAQRGYTARHQQEVQGTEVKPGVRVDSRFCYPIAECTVCRSKEGRTTQESNYVGRGRGRQQGTVHCTISKAPMEALTRALQGMGEVTSAGIAILSTIITFFSL